MIRMVIGGIVGGLIFVLLTSLADYEDFIVIFLSITGIITGIIAFIVGDKENSGCSFGFGGFISGAIGGGILGALISNIPSAVSIVSGVVIGGGIGIMLERDKNKGIARELRLDHDIFKKRITDIVITDKSYVETTLDFINDLSYGVKKMLANEISILNEMLAVINALAFLDKAKLIKEKCESNIDSGKKIILTPTYKSADLQEKAWNTFNNISLKMQKLESTVKEINAKGDK